MPEKNLFPLSPKDAEYKAILASTDQPHDAVIKEINRNAVFPTRLRGLREEMGVSQQKAAEEIGINKASLSYYEQGDNVPDIKGLKKLADYYSVSYDFLLGNSDARKAENMALADSLGINDSSISRLRQLKNELDNGLRNINNDSDEDAYLKKRDILQTLNELICDDEALPLISEYLFTRISYAGKLHFTVEGKNTETAKTEYTRPIRFAHLQAFMISQIRDCLDKIQSNTFYFMEDTPSLLKMIDEASRDYYEMEEKYGAEGEDENH